MSAAEVSNLYPVPQQDELVNIPEELKARRQFVPWKLKRRKNRKTGEIRWDKVPYTAEGKLADTTDLTTWAGFEEAMHTLEFGVGYRGIGFVFCSGDPYTGIDLDGCRDPESGEIEEWAQRIVHKLDGYTECSPSGKGVHIIVRGKVPRPRNTKSIEVYSIERFFTLTGKAL